MVASLPEVTDKAAFAGRVAASLLNAIGLLELIPTTPDSYDRIATFPELFPIRSSPYGAAWKNRFLN
jgi:hypothetical protein